MCATTKEYGAILVDTSIFDRNRLCFERGLLKALSQFNESPVFFLFPDVIFNEVKSHLNEKIKKTRLSLEKSLNDASEYFFFEGSELNDVKQVLIDSEEIYGLAESRISKFISATDALVLECGDYVSVCTILDYYFSKRPPFSDKKKSEFPDAIVLLAVEAWAEANNIFVLAIAKDLDWKEYCECSQRIDYEEDLSVGLNIFNSINLPYQLLEKLKRELDSGDADEFLAKIRSQLESFFECLDLEQEAESSFYWEPEGCHAWFKDFHFVDNEFRVVEKGDDWITLEATAYVAIGAAGEFSFSVYDSIDKDDVYLGGIQIETEEDFKTELLVTVYGNFGGSVNELSVDDVEVINPIGSIDFGLVEPDFGDE